MDYKVLAAELTNDPLGRGYAAMTDFEAAESLNAANRTRNKATVAGQEILETVDISEYNALTADQKSLLHAIIGIDRVQVNAPNTRAALLSMFGPGTDTRANLIALAKENCSRARELGLPPVREGHVYMARS